jgi:murein DD-endopeptidase MepM/ murein hydrolase activator NlpD
MQSKWDAMKGRPAILLVGAVCLLAAGIGGYGLLRPAASPVTNIDIPQAETMTPPPAAEVQAEAVIPAPEPAPAPQEEEVPVSKPEFIPDDTPVIRTPPRVVVAPLEGEVVAAFSADRLVYNETLADWRTHDGVDIAAAAGTEVLAASSGTVAAVEADPLMGTTVVIDHADGFRTTYANLQESPDVAEGDAVSAGQRIGAVGISAAEAAQGPHLHFSVSKDGVPMDPNEYLG